VDEATAKELRAKKAVEKTKKDVAKKAEEELRKLEIDSEAEANNATNSTPMWNESRNGTNSTWDLPTGKPDEWKGYTDVDLKKMLKKAAMKQKFLCKSAELLPNLATKAKAASDQAYVESRRTQVKRVAEISKMDEIEKSKYQERKVKSYSKSKEMFQKAHDKAKVAAAQCEDARLDSDVLRRKVAEAKTTGFVKMDLPKPAYTFKDSEITAYPKCRKIFAKRDFQAWLALKTDRDLEMSEKEHACRLKKIESEKVRMEALMTGVEAAQASLNSVNGASRCVLQPAIIRMFNMLAGEDPGMTPSIKNFVKAVELHRKMEDPGANISKVDMLYSRRLGDSSDALGEAHAFMEQEIRSGQGDFSLGEDDLPLNQNSEFIQVSENDTPLDRVELGATLDAFERKEEGEHSKQVKETQSKNKAAKELLDEKTVELKEKQGVAFDKEQAVKNEMQMKNAAKAAQQAPEAKYTCLYEEFENALGPSAKKLTMKYKLSKHTVDGELNKLKKELSKAEEEAKAAAGGGADQYEVRLGSARTNPAPAETFSTSENFNFPIRRDVESQFLQSLLQLGESSQAAKGGEDLPGCAAFYSGNAPKNPATPVKKKPVAELPPPPGRRLLQGRAAATEQNPNEDPPPTEARNPRDLQMKITAYVMRMTRRAARISDQILDDVKARLDAATAARDALKVSIKNAHNLVKVERLKMGNEEKIMQGRCLGDACFKGVMFKGLYEGEEVTWTCNRGMTGKKEVRLAFSCSMETKNKDMHMCVGKEVWFGTFWVPFLKEVQCPEEVGQACTENRQCGSEDLPLTKNHNQRKVRNECAAL